MMLMGSNRTSVPHPAAKRIRVWLCHVWRALSAAIFLIYKSHGGVAERTMALVLKTSWGGIPSKVRILPPPPIETSRFERVAPLGREAAALRKIPRRFAANWLAGQKSKTADLLRTRGFVPIF